MRGLGTVDIANDKEAARLDALSAFPEIVRRLAGNLQSLTTPELASDVELSALVASLHAVADQVAGMAARQEQRIRRRGLHVVNNDGVGPGGITPRRG